MYKSLALGVMTLASVLSSASEARACPSRESWQGPEASTIHVRADSTLTFLWQCDASCTESDPPPAFQIVDPAGSLVAGSVVNNGLVNGSMWLAWKPDAQLTQDVTYSIVVDGTARAVFVFSPEASPDFDPSQARIQVTSSARGFGGEETECCDSSCGGTACWSRQVRNTIAIDVQDQSEPNHAGFQWLFKATLTIDGVVQPTTETWSLSFSQALNTQASQVCYSVDATHPITGEVVHAGDGCRPIGTFPLGVRDATSDELRGYLRGCLTPPPGYEALWPHRWEAVSSEPSSDAGTASEVDANVGASSTEAGVEALIDKDGGSGCTLAGERSAVGAWLLALLMMVRRKRA